MAKRRVLGIDLGTTYSCVAYVNDVGKPEVIPNQSDERTTPSVVWFDGPDRVIVGQEAKSMAGVYPNNVCSFIKRQMGKDEYTYEVNGVQYSPEHISSFILRKLVNDACKRLGEQTNDVVITCPAYFFVKEREATKRAGEMAGLNVLQIVNEPTAAAIDYGTHNKSDGGNILVYDLGGGTFDVTVMTVGPQGLDVVCTDGDHQLGGKDWDDCLTRYFAQRFAEETGAEVDLGEDPEFYYDLMERAENAKKHLSSKNSVSVTIARGGDKARFDVTREEFESLTQGLVERTIELTTNCLRVADDKGIELPSQIVLVGGSSRMPQIARRIEEVYDIKPTIFDPDEAVAKGAAIIGNNHILKEQVVEKLSATPSRGLLVDDASEADRQQATQRVAEETGYSVDIVKQAMRAIRNVSSKTFGAISTADNGFRSVSNIIYRNTPLPCEDTQTFTTVSNGQTSVLVELMENLADRSPTQDQDIDALPFASSQEEFDRLFWRIYSKEEESTKLWEGELNLPCALPANSPIDITYMLDESGLLTLVAQDQTTGARMVQTIQTGSSPTSREYQAASQASRALIVE